MQADGETLYLVNSNQTRVLDALRFGGQGKGVAFGRYPDGAPDFRRLGGRTSGTTNALRGISCLSSTTCWAVGDLGTIIATTNGGTTWPSQNSATTANLNSVSCPTGTDC